MKFRAELRLNGKTATGIQVPDEIVASFGSRRPAVRVTINGHSYRSTVAAMGGEFLLPVSAENRQAAGISAGDEVDVDLEADTEPREVTVPDDLAEAFAGDSEARDFFAGLSYSHKRAYTLWIDGAKKPETRRRRVTQAVEMLHEKRRR
ncbi:YdeI/OmpD-associated family protein [Amycolatopsis sp.]|uniref:YdeI/OmpD-associated family protein n=1 Tax=Amycolatopsis sp. TaxID=37632 RepID=UPI002B5FA60C|nr:YdeI/OmpD-associated family protein [Amycolatopsis sp.]HVV09441.1 YdeI/OmpD-associated family protein [Amycolatopsis sp.]